MKRSWNYQDTIQVSMCLFLSMLLFLLCYCCMLIFLYGRNILDSDNFGLFNAVASIFTILLLFFTLLLQRKSTDKIADQQFENTFYNLLKFFNNTKEKMKFHSDNIQDDNILCNMYKIRQMGLVTNTLTLSSIKALSGSIYSAEVFAFISELLFPLLKDFKNKPNTNTPIEAGEHITEETMESINAFGELSNVLTMLADHGVVYIELLEKAYRTHRELYIKISQSILGRLNISNYIKTLQHVIKVIDSQHFEANMQKDFEKKCFYVETIATQLSIYELFFLFFYCLPEENNFEINAEFKELIERYSLLHGINTDDIIFKQYINPVDTPKKNNNFYNPRAFDNPDKKYNYFS